MEQIGNKNRTVYSYGNNILVWIALVFLTALNIAFAGMNLGNITTIIVFGILAFQVFLIQHFYIRFNYKSFGYKLFTFSALIILLVLLLLFYH